MNTVVSGLLGCAVYLDNVAVYSDSWQEHVQHIQALFDRLTWANLTVNLAKCEFAKATGTYLGKVVGQGAVRPVTAKVGAIEKFPSPTTKRELSRFLGMVGYYRGFCQHTVELLHCREKKHWHCSTLRCTSVRDVGL